MAVNLDFAGQRTAYASHGMHSFAARFPPQLARWGIERFSDLGERVLDPMVGSGTTLVESRLLGRHGLGVDIDPLARLIAGVKSTPIDPSGLAAGLSAFHARARLLFHDLRLAREHGIPFHDAFREVAIPDFPNRDYWFLPNVVEELALLRHLIDRVGDVTLRRFFYLAFSSTIITKSASSVANVRDLAHSRPHRVAPARPPDVFRAFETRLARLERSMAEFAASSDPRGSARVIGDDARALPLPDASVDLVFTSPPYVNAIDYPRAHKFSLFWLGHALGTSSEAYRDLGRRYIGTDRVPLALCRTLARRTSGLGALDRVLDRLADADPRRAGIARQYFDDMARVIAEAGRVLRPGRHAIVVVCPSTIAGVSVPTHELLAAVGEMSGLLSHVETHSRVLDDAKRQLPIVRGRFGPGMRTEYVVVLRRT